MVAIFGDGRGPAPMTSSSPVYGVAVLHHAVEPPSGKVTLGETVHTGARRFWPRNFVVAGRPPSQ